MVQSAKKTRSSMHRVIRSIYSRIRKTDKLYEAVDSLKVVKTASNSLSAGGFTVGDLCSVIGVEVPDALVSKVSERVSGIDARPGQLRTGDVFFDAQAKPEDVERASASDCFFIVTQDETFRNDEIGKPVVIVDDALKAYVSACRKIISDHRNLVRVAVGGSSGKTSMKDMVSFVMGEQCLTQKSFSNSNNIFGIGKQMGRLTKMHRCYVQEVGLASDGRGEVTKQLAEIYHPNIAILTNIGDNHKEQYASKELIFHYKSQIAEFVEADGLVLLNKDDPLLSAYKPGAQTWYYSIVNDDADVFAFNIRAVEDGMIFDIRCKEDVFKDVRIKVHGEHNVYNALASFATARFLGYDGDAIVEALGKFELTYQTRQNYKQIGHVNHYIDCFNSSPESVSNALKTVSAIRLQEGAKRIAVLGDIAELGEESPLLHEQVGREVGNFPIDHLVCFGSEAVRIYQSALDAGVRAYYAESRDDLERYVCQLVAPGDLIVWKASHSMHFELSIDDIWGTDFYTLYPEDGDGETSSCGEFQYRLYKNGAKVTKYNGCAEDVRLSGSYAEMPVRTVGYRAFKAKKIKKIAMSPGFISVGREAFFACSNLIEVCFPDTLKYIGSQSFKQCVSLERLVIPETCTHIDKEAFSRCFGLKEIVFLGDGTAIDDDAFQDCEGVSFVCRIGSSADSFAKRKGISLNYVE